MYIKELYISHTGIIDVGRLASFIVLDTNGIYIKMQEIVDKVILFNRVVLLGNPFEQKDDVAKFCKLLIKQKDDIKIEINTSGMIRPIGVANIDNIIYYVYLNLKSSGIDYKTRINYSVINWFNEIGANFIFNINTENDLDETNLIVQDCNISKKDTFLTFDDSEKLHMIRLWAKRYGYNFAPDFKKLLWEDEGKK